MEYIYKEKVMEIIGLDKNKAGDWKTYFELFEIAFDDIIYGRPKFMQKFIQKDIGYSSPEYMKKRKKYKSNELPTLLKGYEYLSKAMVKLMTMRADTEKARKQRLKSVF